MDRDPAVSASAFRWRNLPISSEMRCYVLPFYHSRNPLFRNCQKPITFDFAHYCLQSIAVLVSLLSSSMFILVSPVFPVALIVSSKTSFWMFSTHSLHLLTLVLNLGTASLHLLQCFSDLTFPKSFHDFLQLHPCSSALPGQQHSVICCFFFMFSIWKV